MDVVLGLSMTPTTVHIVVVDGEMADGATVERETLDIVPVDNEATANAADQVIAAIMGTRQGAVAVGDRLVSTGITWSNRAQAAELRLALADSGVDGVVMVSQLQAAAALGQAAGTLADYAKTAVLMVAEDMATLSVVDTADASIVKVDSRPLADGQATAVLTDMLTDLRGHWSKPDGMFVVGPDHDLAAVKQLAQDLLSIPVRAPADGAHALARGAALAAAKVSEFDPSTTAFAYSQVPDAAAAGMDDAADVAGQRVSADDQRGRKPFLLVGTAMVAIFMVGVTTLVISLALSIRPTVDSRPRPNFSIGTPTVAPQAPGALTAQPPGVAPPAQTGPPTPAARPPASPVPVISPPALAAQEARAPAVQQTPVYLPTQAAAAPAPEAPPSAPVPAAAPPAPAPEASPPAPAPAAVPGYPPTGYSPGYGQVPGYAPGPGYSPQPAYGPGYTPGYAPAPVTPMIPIIPGILSIGPGPSYGPRWVPPQRQEPSVPSYVPGQYPSYGPGQYGGGRPPWMWPPG